MKFARPSLLMRLLGPSSATVAHYEFTLAAGSNAAIPMSPLTAMLDLRGMGNKSWIT